MDDKYLTPLVNEWTNNAYLNIDMREVISLQVSY